MTRSEYRGHLETVRKVVRANNGRLETMPMMGGARAEVFMSEDVLRSFPGSLDAMTRRALEQFPYCLAVRNVAGERALRQADRTGARDVADLQARQFSQALKSVMVFPGGKAGFRQARKRNGDGTWTFFFLCPFKISKIKYSLAGCAWLPDEP